MQVSNRALPKFFPLVYLWLGVFSLELLALVFDYRNSDLYGIMQAFYRGNGSLAPLFSRVGYPQILQTALWAAANVAIVWGILWLAINQAQRLESLSRRAESIPDRWFLGPLCVMAFSIYAWGLHVTLQDFPMSGDEHSYLLQAKILLSGRLWVPPHPLTEFFTCDWIINEGKVYSIYPLGNPALLALGEMAGAPWLIVPLLGALALPVMYKLARKYYPQGQARLGIILVALFPLAVGLNGSYFPHAGELFFLSLFVYLLLTAQEQNRPLRAMSSGLALGMAVNIRPQTAIIFSALFILHLLRQLIRRPRENYKIAIYFGLGLILPAGIVLLANLIQNGHPLVSGYQVFYKDPTAHGQRLLKRDLSGIKDLLFRMRLLWDNLRYYPFSGLIPLIGIFAALKDRTRYVYFFTGTFLLACLAYMFTLGSIWQLRYYYEPLAFLVLLVPVGLSRLIKSWVKGDEGIAARFLGMAAVVIVATKLFTVAQTGFTPAPYMQQLRKPYDTVKAAGIKNALVFIRQVEPFYPKWYTRNRPDFSDDVLFVLDWGEKNRQLMDFYPQRKYYIYEQGKLSEIVR